MELIKDKVVIVTGAAAGIGAGVAKLFTEGGAHVFLADLDGLGVKKVAAASARGRRLGIWLRGQCRQSRRHGKGGRGCDRPASDASMF